MSANEQTMREDMEAAIEQVEIKEETTDSTPPSGADHAQQDTPTPEKPQKEVSQAQPPATELSEEVSRKATNVPAKAEPGKDTKPPVNWGPALRESWHSLPGEVREVISKRERDVNMLLQNTAAARKFSDEFVRVVEPFRPLMAAEGVQNPLQAVQGLMQVTATLQLGTPQQKAQRIAGLCKHYGIDVELLDQALVGQTPQNNPQSDMERMVDQRLAPINQLVARAQQEEQRQHWQMQQHAGQSVEQFGNDPQNEFYPHVRMEMGNWLDMAANHGQPMSLKEAYDRACAMSPEILQVLSSRQRNGGMLGRKRAAASSLPAKSGSSGSTGERSLRDEIEANFGDMGRI